MIAFHLEIQRRCGDEVEETDRILEPISRLSTTILPTNSTSPPVVIISFDAPVHTYIHSSQHNRPKDDGEMTNGEWIARFLRLKLLHFVVRSIEGWITHRHIESVDESSALSISKQQISLNSLSSTSTKNRTILLSSHEHNRLTQLIILDIPLSINERKLIDLRRRESENMRRRKSPHGE